MANCPRCACFGDYSVLKNLHQDTFPCAARRETAKIRKPGLMASSPVARAWTMVTGHGPRPHRGEDGHRAQRATAGETPRCIGAFPCVGKGWVGRG